MVEGQTTYIRRWWTEEEDRILRREAALQLKDGPLSDWNRIAAKLPHRSNKDCRKRWGKISTNVKKGTWDPSEDRRLLAAVKKHGLCWTEVAQEVGTRHADQCAKRWQHSLDPNIIHSKWTPEEDERLIRAVETYGRTWSKINEEEFPKRSTTDLKNRHALILRRRHSRRSLTIYPEQNKTLNDEVDFEESSSDDNSNQNMWPEDTEMGNTNSEAALFPSTANAPSILPDSGLLNFEQPWTPPAAIDNIFTTDAPTSADPDTTFPAICWNSVDFAGRFRALTDSSTEIVDLMDPLSASRIDSIGTDTLSPPASISTIQSLDTNTSVSSNGSSTPSSKHTLVLQNAEPHTLRNILDILYKDRVRYKLDVDHD